MVLSYSLHVGNKAHALTTVAKVSSASKHNLRKYKSEEYNKDNIVQLVGSDNILNDVKQIYHFLYTNSLIYHFGYSKILFFLLGRLYLPLFSIFRY